MISIVKENCCGCAVCEQICPNAAITMKADSEGFLYPNINNSLCSDCGLCKAKCTFTHPAHKNDITAQKVFALKHKDDTVRTSSTSGGAFTAISDYILSIDGSVFGVVFDERFHAQYTCARNIEERDRMRGSKYVQADSRSILNTVQRELAAGKTVLFTGTPCVCESLRDILSPSEKERLIICDIVCHGVPSPLLWEQHIDSIKKIRKMDIASYYCRSKTSGWHTHDELCIFSNGKQEHATALTQKHRTLFYTQNILRPSCYNCKYSSLDRVSDITIGDFWGIENSIPEIDDNRGVSLILINTDKGMQIFNFISRSCNYWQSNSQNCIQPQLVHPAIRPNNRDKFWTDYYEKGYIYIAKKYGGYNLVTEIKRKIKAIIS